MKALVIAPYKLDDPLYSSSIAARNVMTILEANGFAVDVLEYDNATRDKFEAVMMKKDFDVVGYFGHGHSEDWVGQPGRGREPLLDMDNVSLLSGSFVVAITCLSGRILGKVAATSSAWGYVGFSDLLYLPLSVRDRNYEADFLRTFVSIFLALVHGYTLHQTKEQFEKVCGDYERLYEAERPQFYRVAQKYMAFNRDHIMYAGNPNMNMGREIIEM